MTQQISRDTQKTQHGIETIRPDPQLWRRRVETLRKPSTGLKQYRNLVAGPNGDVETLRKPSTGLKHCLVADAIDHIEESRHSENPARD